MCNCGYQHYTPLFYTEDDWGYTTSKVLARIKPGEGPVVKHTLTLCTKCYSVFALPDEIVEEY